MDYKTLELLFAETEAQERAEQQRLEAFRTRAGTLLGLTGVILALETTQSATVLTDANALGAAGRVLGTILLALGVSLTAVAGGLTLWVLRGIPVLRVSDAELDAFNTDGWLEKSPDQVLGQRMATTAERVIDQRRHLGDAQRRLTHALMILAVGLLMVAGNVFVFLDRAVDDPCASGASIAATLDPRDVGTDRLRVASSASTVAQTARLVASTSTAPRRLAPAPGSLPSGLGTTASRPAGGGPATGVTASTVPVFTCMTSERTVG